VYSAHSFAFAAWLCNLAPYILVSRSCFVYHYMPGLLYAELLAAIWVDRISFK
jgi:dolichyl-phosphate-mannose--protein O-mannosyl transferase